MQNIHLIPTNKPSRLHLGNSGLVLCDLNFSKNTINGQNIYITNDEEIKEGDLACHKNITNDKYQIIVCTVSNKESIQEHWNKIILTTDQDLIDDGGVQSIDNEFLEWFVKNPSCEEVKIESWQTKGEWDLDYKIIIPREEPKQETLDKKYTEEDMIKFAFDTYCYISGIMKVPFNKVSENRTHAEDNFKEYIKSLNKQDK